MSAATNAGTSGVTPAAPQPIAWVRQHPDGTLTDELLPDSRIEDVRKRSGAWVPLGRIAGVAVVDEPNSPGVQKAMARFYRKRMELLLTDYRKALAHHQPIQGIEDQLLALAEGIAGVPSAAPRKLADGELWTLIHKDFPFACKPFEPLLTFSQIKAVVELALATYGVGGKQ